MKITCLSDTHGGHHEFKDVGSGDVVVFAGDVTNVGELHLLVSFLNWAENLNFKHKILVAGNHDWCFSDRNRYLAIEECSIRGIIYLEDSKREINGVNFYGSPWQPEFCDWAFNLPRGNALLEKWSMIPNDTDVLITHTPPSSILDVNLGDEHCGCEDLFDEVTNRVKPMFHVFGHIHLGYGVCKKENTVFINASICDEEYNLTNKPLSFIIDKS